MLFAKLGVQEQCTDQTKGDEQAEEDPDVQNRLAMLLDEVKGILLLKSCPQCLVVKPHRQKCFTYKKQVGISHGRAAPPFL
jgi:hypothetical protein